MDWKWELLIGLVLVCASGYLGYVLGLKAKRPHVVIDFIKTNDDETYIRLNNIGESPAKDVQVQDATINFKLKPSEPFYEQLNGSSIVFKFDKISYIEPHKPKDAKATALINGKDESDSARQLYSCSLDQFKSLCLTYKDNFGFRYQAKLKEFKIEF